LNPAELSALLHTTLDDIAAAGTVFAPPELTATRLGGDPLQVTDDHSSATPASGSPIASPSRTEFGPGLTG
jgi:hypothetical protein